jgi:hypothetical protein
MKPELKRRYNLSRGNRDLMNAIEKRYPRLGFVQREVLGNELITRAGRSLAAGENLGSVRQTGRRDWELTVWDIDKIVNEGGI